MNTVEKLARMSTEELCVFAARLFEENVTFKQTITLKQLKTDQLTHEMAIMKRWKFAARSEQPNVLQGHLFDETIEADIAAIALELKALQTDKANAPPKETPKRAPLPANLPRTEIRHEPDSTAYACGCALKRIGEDVTTTRPVCSRWNATSAASGCARSAGR